MSKLLLAISGGPDSMALLHMMRRKKNVIVAHVNYHVRPDSDVDEGIVRNFCLQNNLRCEVLGVDGKTQSSKNFQNWARKTRYAFFKKLYLENDCKVLLMAHHKDDFLETAEMQARSKREPNYFGIRRKNTVEGMKIKRPFLHLYWKDELLEYDHNKKIPFAIDSSNAQPVYERNVIRSEIAQWTLKEKKNRFKWYVLANRILKKKQRKVAYFYNKWEKTRFGLNFFRHTWFKHELVFEYVHRNYVDIKLSSDKIDSIVSFIESQSGGKEYILSEKFAIKKEGKHLVGVKK